MTSTYRFGGFSPADAQALDGKVVTVTTHDDVEKDTPGQMVGPYRARYVAGKPYLMLVPVDDPADSIERAEIVYLTYVHTVTECGKAAA